MLSWADSLWPQEKEIGRGLNSVNHLCFAEHTCAHFVCDPLNKKNGEGGFDSSCSFCWGTSSPLNPWILYCCLFIYLIVYPQRIIEADEYTNASLLTPPVIVATFSHILRIISLNSDYCLLACRFFIMKFMKIIFMQHPHLMSVFSDEQSSF